MVTINAPAKINLTLEVLGKRPDGYHEIRSVIQTVSLCDVLTFSEARTTEISSRTPGWEVGRSLVLKTIGLVRKATGCQNGIAIEVQKRVPLMAGLGGDSSDAAATLRGLNEIWKLGLRREKLLEIARKLGSDVSFFPYGGTCLLEGRGEIVTPLPTLPHHHIIIVNPAVPHLPGKTAAMYASLKKSHFTDGEITSRLVSDLKSGKDFSTTRLFNTFENVAFTRGTEMTTYRSHLRKMGAPQVSLAGTGPALFIMLDEKAKADDLLIRIQNQGMEAYIADTGEIR